MAAVAPHTVSPTSSKKKIGRSTGRRDQASGGTHGGGSGSPALLAVDVVEQQLVRRDVEHGVDLVRVGIEHAARRAAARRTGR